MINHDSSSKQTRPTKNDKKIAVMYVNINSLRNKISHIEWEVGLAPYIDIIALSETHIGPEIYTGELKIKGFQMFRKDRNVQGGGVAVYVKLGFRTTIIDTHSNCEALFLKITSDVAKFYLLTAYRPPNNSDPLLIPSLFDEINNLINIKNDHLVICGDFNFPKINWTTMNATGNYSLCSPFLHKVLELSLEQHVFSPTHRLGNILDLVLSNKAIIDQLEVFDPSISDHGMIIFKLNLSNFSIPANQEFKVYQYGKADLGKAQTIFKEYEEKIRDSINTKSNINLVYSLLLKGLLAVREECVPSKTHKTSHQPGWFSYKIKNALKKQKKLYTITKFCNSEYSTNRYKLVQKQNKKLIKYAKKSHLAKTLYKPLQNGDSKAFYKHLRQNRENGSNIIPNLKYQNRVAETSIDKANLLNDFFQTVFSDDDGLLVPLPNKTLSFEDTDITVTSTGVLKLLEEINVSKSCGPDNITGIHLKTFSIVIANSMADFFNFSLSTGSQPDIWKEAQVTAIHKKGSKQLPNNYRPVSLTCIMCKLLEHVIAHHIHNFLDTNNLLVASQHGFRGGRSCETQLVHTINDFAYNHETGLITDIVILDFSKAFDTVSHRKLLYKLSVLGIHEKIIAWIKGFLQNRGQVVRVEGSLSHRCSVKSGVPQGSVLGPLLFLIYINDLTDQLSSECRLFADDALLYNTREKAQLLQEDLKKLDEWSKNWQLSFNVGKCSVMSIKDSSLSQSYYLNNRRLENVNTHPYLGIEFNYDLKWNAHINKIVAKSTSLLGMLWRVLKSADTRTRQLAYYTLIRPNLEYGCVAWDPYFDKDIKQLEKLQNKAVKFIFNLRGQVNYTAIKESSNIQLLKDRRKELRVNLFCKATASGVIKDTYKQEPEQIYNTRQEGGLYVPSIKTKAYFNSFWPRTTREIRDGI